MQTIAAEPLLPHGGPHATGQGSPCEHSVTGLWHMKTMMICGPLL